MYLTHNILKKLYACKNTAFISCCDVCVNRRKWILNKINEENFLKLTSLDGFILGNPVRVADFRVKCTQYLEDVKTCNSKRKIAPCCVDFTKRNLVTS